MLEDKDFELLDNTPETEEVVDNDVEITADDFTLTQVDETVHEQKFQTKPTTFLKDSLKRFRKNKSSVVATYILGGLLLMSVLVPLFDTSDTKNPHPSEIYLAPKLFDAGTGWWDGTVTYDKIAVDISEMPHASTDEEKQEHWWPSSVRFPQRSAISKKVFTDEQYTNDISNLGTFGKEGYVQFGYYYNREKDDVVEFSTQQIASLTIDNDLYLSVFDTYDVNKINAREGKDGFKDPENYVLGKSALYFNYTDDDGNKQEVQLVDYNIVHNIGSAVTSVKEPELNIASIIGANTYKKAYFSVRMIADGKGHNTCTLIGGIAFESTSTNAETKKAFDEMSFTDATSNATKSLKDGYQYWSSTGVRRVYLSKAYFVSFVYDTYEAAFGDRDVEGFSIFNLLNYQKNGWLSFDSAFGPTLWDDDSGFYLDTNNFTCTILDKEKCPLAKPIQLSDFSYPTPDEDGISSGNITVKATVTNYKVLGYDKMPRYLMGTDKSGRDMFKYVFEGLRTSLLLGVLTFVVCFLFGLLWGSICGYFGGTVDLLMERFTDILAGIPWIVVMTLIIIHMGSTFWTFALALCMTGWIGTAARTRTQFYRFRGREYVLASRTLGASDARLIAKHILPNALGTIITGAVLMIPSVIFSEATISYLGLGLKNLASLGVILSDNQAELMTSSYLLIFPAVVIALIMISFNLFGNGLRDAINPSLKGED
ncbi:MAG: ABC transporter permease [Bacilli bacterium]|nr:ABC transporter permease [Bacilli bacterium]